MNELAPLFKEMMELPLVGPKAMLTPTPEIRHLAENYNKWFFKRHGETRTGFSLEDLINILAHQHQEIIPELTELANWAVEANIVPMAFLPSIVAKLSLSAGRVLTEMINESNLLEVRSVIEKGTVTDSTPFWEQNIINIPAIAREIWCILMTVLRQRLFFMTGKSDDVEVLLNEPFLVAPSEPVGQTLDQVRDDRVQKLREWRQKYVEADDAITPVKLREEQVAQDMVSIFKTGIPTVFTYRDIQKLTWRTKRVLMERSYRNSRQVDLLETTLGVLFDNDQILNLERLAANNPEQITTAVAVAIKELIEERQAFTEVGQPQHTERIVKLALTMPAHVGPVVSDGHRERLAAEMQLNRLPAFILMECTNWWLYFEREFKMVVEAFVKDKQLIVGLVENEGILEDELFREEFEKVFSSERAYDEMAHNLKLELDFRAPMEPDFNGSIPIAILKKLVAYRAFEEVKFINSRLRMVKNC